MINHVAIQGRFTKEIDMKYTPTGIPVATFTIAWNEKYGEKESVCFLNCVAFRSTAEFLSNYFRKGDQTIVEGKMVTRNYEDSQGQKKYVTELVVDKAHFCGSKKDKGSERSESIQDVYMDIEDDTDNDLPF